MQTIITSKRHWLNLNIPELVRYKDLFYFLAWRDIKVRYKQTVIGIAWAFLVPIITMVVFTIFFGNYANIDSNGAPYPIFVYLGLLFWTFFSQAITNSSNSLVTSQDIVKKIYFPKLLLPASAIFVNLIDFGIATAIYIVMAIYFKAVPTTSSLFIIPIIIVITYIAALGLGVLLAAINVKYRDVRYVVVFILQILLFVTPVIYPVSLVSNQYRWILYLNPMAGVIETARAVLLGSTSIPWPGLMIAAIMSISFLICGLIYFRKTEDYFSDII